MSLTRARRSCARRTSSAASGMSRRVHLVAHTSLPAVGCYLCIWAASTWITRAPEQPRHTSRAFKSNAVCRLDRRALIASSHPRWGGRGWCHRFLYGHRRPSRPCVLCAVVQPSAKGSCRDRWSEFSGTCADTGFDQVAPTQGSHRRRAFGWGEFAVPVIRGPVSRLPTSRSVEFTGLTGPRIPGTANSTQPEAVNRVALGWGDSYRIGII